MKQRRVLAYLLWQALALILTLFGTFVAAHLRPLVLRTWGVGTAAAWVVVAGVLTSLDDAGCVRLLGSAGWCFSTQVPLGVAIRPLGAAYLALGLLIAWFVPRYQAHGLGSQQGTLRSVLFPFKALALTFDDGPDPTWTPRVLEELRKERVKATFFMVGENLLRYPEVAREVVRQGHTVGVHGHAHRLLPLLSAADLEDDFERAERAFQEVLGFRPRFFRPPWGAYNRRVLDAARARGYLTVLWTRSAEDWRNLGVERIVQAATRDLRLGEIVLLHDAGNYPRPSAEDLARGPVPGQDREQTVLALRSIIQGAEAQGFQLKDLNEMVAAWLS